MSEELEDNNDGTWSGLKKTILGVLTTAVMGVGTWGITQLTSGGGDDSAPAQQVAPVINITNTNEQSQSPGVTKIIEREKVVEKPSEIQKPKKKEGDEFKEEAPKW
jgi:hypothetical protein